jgi:hypothetical protein
MTFVSAGKSKKTGSSNTRGGKIRFGKSRRVNKSFIK